MRCRLMIAVLTLLPAIAQGAEEGSRAGASSGWGLSSTLSAAGGLIAVVSLAWLLFRFLKRCNEKAKHDPRNLLHELCLAHGLSRRAERVLRKAATAVGSPHPGRFFLEPQLLERAGKCEQLKAHQRALGLLYERLFGEEE